MATTIELKNSVTTGNSPSSLAQGETAWNITDKNVWIGNASSTPIQLIGAGASMTLNSLTASTLSSPAATALTLQSAGTTAITVDTSQNVGIGTSSPYAKLQVLNIAKISDFTQGLGLLSLGDGLSTANNVGVWRGAANSVVTAGNYLNLGGYDGTVFSTGNQALGSQTERMRIDSSGTLLVGGTSNIGSGYKTVIYSGGNVLAQSTTGGNGTLYSAFFNSTTQIGTISNNNNTGVLYNVTSDYRLKTVLAPVTDAGQRIDALQPIEYDWKVGGRTRGFLAHQFAEVYPDSVTGEKDAIDAEGKAVYQSMQSSSPEVMADLIAEIQSLRKRVAQLESK